MAWQLLAAALPYAAQAVGQYINKPRAEEYKPQTDYMKKYLSYLRGRQADKEVYNMAMQPALRAIGAQGRKMQREVGYQTARAGVAGTGIEAQQRLSAGQMTLQAIQEAGEKATAAQMVESRRLGERAEDVTARIGAEEGRAQQAYQTAQSQWKRQMVATGVQAVGAIAGGAITQAGQARQASSYALETGLFGDEANVTRLIDEGWNLQMFQNQATVMNKLIGGVMKGEDQDTLGDALSVYKGIDLSTPGVEADSALAALETGAMEHAGMVKKKPVNISDIVPEVVEPPPKGKEITTIEQAEAAGLVVKKDVPVVEKPEGFVEDDYSTYPKKVIEEAGKAAVKPEVKKEEVKTKEAVVSKDKPVKGVSVSIPTKSGKRSLYDFRWTGNIKDGKYEFKENVGSGAKTMYLTLEEFNARTNVQLFAGMFKKKR